MLFHNKFRLNEQSFETINGLLEFSKSVSSDVYLFLNDWFDASDSIKVHTSGSTGKPKEILLKKEYMVNSAIATGTYFSLFENTDALLCMSVNYIAGKMMLVRAMVLGWNLDIVQPNAKPLENCQKTYDFSAMVPLQLKASLNSLEKVQRLIVGGGVVSSKLIESLQQVTTKIYATYGMTETITHIAVKKLNNFDFYEEKSYYELLPNISISLDSRGCLVIEAPKLSEDLVITNDLVSIINEKKFEWQGRYDTVINSGGVKLIPEEIELRISEIIQHRFFVSSLKDDELGEKLILIIEGKGEALLQKMDILDYLRGAKLEKYQVPKCVYFIENFIETETRKIHRSKTLELLYLS